jgi:hypothetical protein
VALLAEAELQGFILGCQNQARIIHGHVVQANGALGDLALRFSVGGAKTEARQRGEDGDAVADIQRGEIRARAALSEGCSCRTRGFLGLFAPVQ